MQNRTRLGLVSLALGGALACTEPPRSPSPEPAAARAPRAQPAGADPAAARAAPNPTRPAVRTPPGTGIGEPIAAFTAEVIPPGGGTPAAIDSRKVTRPTAYVFLGTTCPTTESYGERLKSLEKIYGDKADFVYLYPNSTDTVAAKRKYHATKGFSRGWVDDQGGRVAKLLGARRTSEVVLTDARANVVYHGAIDDSRDPARVSRRHLAMALDETLSGRKVTTPKTDVDA